MLADNSPRTDTAMADADRSFYVQLGQRLAEQRKAQGITQVQMAERLGVAQQTMAHYEGGTVRIGVETLAHAAQVFGVAVEDLIGTGKRSAAKRGPQPKIAQQLQQIEALPKAKQRAISQVLDSVIAAHL
ncbi:MAG: XRE family transcriptional regulator [Xanthomonadales bacterium]|nr:MAG: helix-turn-helix transcriptional regulator [Candidatus Contendobacter sp.]MBC6942020.1 XRE family transcriptional regulator [Xanthomonadales bacterium]MDL1869216.1 helix-turn-helix transcriptional regulator [Gammaproteobacteria bacterium PRO6]